MVADRVGQKDLVADRWTPFNRSIAFLRDFGAGVVFKMQIRNTPDAVAALIDLPQVVSASAEGVRLVYNGTATLADHIANNRWPDGVAAIAPSGAAYALTDNVPLTLVGIRINETTVEALPFPQERGDDLILSWDLLITPTGGLKEKWMEGKFIVHAGTTQT
jgi:hypothetical protein